MSNVKSLSLSYSLIPSDGRQFPNCERNDSWMVSGSILPDNDALRKSVSMMMRRLSSVVGLMVIFASLME